MNCSVFIKNSETSKMRVKNMRSLLYCSTSFPSSTFPTSSVFMSGEEITRAKLLKKNSISLLSFLSAASSLIPVVFLFLFTKRKILFSIFFSFPSRRVQRGVIKHAPFFLFSISFVVRRWNLPWLFRASPNVVLTFRKAKISQTDVLRRRGFYKQGDRLLRGER